MGQKSQTKTNSQTETDSTTLLMSCVIFLVALNLRPAIVAVGPLLSSIGTTFGWGESLQGLLGALPLLAFALFSIFVSSLTEKLGTNCVLFWALVVLAAGCVVRSFFGENAVWAGTLLIGASIAAGNVLAPAIVKRDFIDRVSFATGAYSACVTSGSAIAGLTASAAADALGGWQPALALWALPALIAAALWLLRSKYAEKQTREKVQPLTHKAESTIIWKVSNRDAKGNTALGKEMGAASESQAQAANRAGTRVELAHDKADERSSTDTIPNSKPQTIAAVKSEPSRAQFEPRKKQASQPHASEKPSTNSAHPLRSLLNRPSTWLVTLFMGLQSAAFYTFCNWLPSIAASAGFTASEAGVHLFIFQALGIFSGLLIPRFMHVHGNQICAGLLASTPLLIAALGWLFAPQLSLVWSIFGGIGQGASLVVALTLISLRGETHAETVALSGFAQSIGYLLAACGPFVFGALIEATGDFAAPLTFMAALAAAQCALSFLAGQTPSKQMAQQRI